MHYWDFIKASSQRKAETGRGQETMRTHRQTPCRTPPQARNHQMPGNQQVGLWMGQQDPAQNSHGELQQKGPYSSQKLSRWMYSLASPTSWCYFQPGYGHWVKASVALLAAQNDRKMELIYGIIIFLSHTGQEIPTFHGMESSWKHLGACTCGRVDGPTTTVSKRQRCHCAQTS